MKNCNYTLFIEINNSNFIFLVGKNDNENNIFISQTLYEPLVGIENRRISDYEKVLNLVKENIYIIEQKLNYTFKEVILILDNFNPSFISLSGYKKLNGSQILRENITYILNSLKSYIDSSEKKKTILHIFNSEFSLDNKKIQNLPIGLFGDFYSHELSFNLIDLNDFKNLKNIFNNSNLKVKKIFLKSFIKGVYISENYNKETFFQITITNKKSKIFFFENNSLKFEQNFKFGTDIVAKDISKITSLDLDSVEEILKKINFNKNFPQEELVEKNFFKNNNFRKIKKSLIYEIALARIREFSEIILSKNINFNYYIKTTNSIFLEISNNAHLKNTKEIYEKAFSLNNIFDVVLLNDLSNENILSITNKLVHFGWNKEAIPISQSKKSLIARFFDAIFG